MSIEDLRSWGAQVKAQFKKITPKTNTIFRGDNLEIMRAMPDEFVDLCYIDPPFFTQRDYKNIWGDKESVLDWESAKLDGFFDTKDFFEKHVQNGEKGLAAYLVWMRVRLIEIHRVLKKDGVFFCHLDHHAVHYVKVILDEIFGYKNFRNEIIWERNVGASNTSTRQFGVGNDTILFYSKSSSWKFNIQYENYSEKYKKSHYNQKTKDGRHFQLTSLVAPGYNPKGVYTYKGYHPPKNGWRWTPQTMKEMDAKGYVSFPEDKSKRLRQIRYLDEQKGVKLSNIWTDIPPVNSQAKDDTGWPTQKPVTLVERIINVGSDENDIVFDCFAGCGTSMHAAHILKRKWIGIDISPTAMKINKKRLEELEAKVNIVDERDLEIVARTE
jgi:DNA modification methylase